MVRFTIPSDPKYLCAIRTVVEQFCLLSGLPNDETDMVVLAIDEASSNIIKHTCSGCADRTISIECSLANSDLEFELRDSGNPVDPGCMKPRDLSEIRPGGLGMHFIQTIMDGIKLEYEPRVGNILTLTKHVSMPPRSG